jgi:hypothetical protein
MDQGRKKTATGNPRSRVEGEDIVEEEKSSQMSKPIHSRFTTTEIMPSATGKQSPKSMVSGSQAPGRGGIHRKGAFSGATSNNLGGSDYEDEALAGVDDDDDDGDDDDEEGDEDDLEMKPDELIVSEKTREIFTSAKFFRTVLLICLLVSSGVHAQIMAQT